MIFFLVTLLFCSKEAIGAEYRIATASDFKTFVANVNSGTTYHGTTVYLDSDLSLSEETLEPVNGFRGAFDGQGHIISDLKMDSDSEDTGLFGYSRGLTIRNVVLDSSCSFTSSYNSKYGYVYTGGIIGSCVPFLGECNIENNVNMANVSFSGNTNFGIYLGGIAGYISWDQGYYTAYVENCANYGSIKHPGTSGDTYIGGIVGYSNGEDLYYVRNCINYGAITHNGITQSTLYLGGILGRMKNTYVENCVSAGEISTPITIPSYSYVGTITGYVYSDTYINYCYSTSDLSRYHSSYGEGTPTSSSYVLDYDSTTFRLIDDVSVGSYTGRSLIDALNAYSDYYLLRDYSKWLLNKKRKSVDFTIDSRTIPITMGYKIILLPSLASEGNTFFDGWYNDIKCTYPLESFEITEDTNLYGKVEKSVLYTITLETGREGVHFAPITAQFGAVVSLPIESERELSNLMFWETEYGYNSGFSLVMPARNLTLYAVWNFTHLTTPEDLIDFSKVVNAGANYSGTTVCLDSDLSLAGKTLEPIGNDTSNFFNGVFDGQGHTISDLRMNPSYFYTGLFGYSEGLTIRNVVLDSSCSITSIFKSGSRGSNNAWVGGIIGECSAKSGECNIENNVNMADVTFSGDTEYYLYIGGIAGWLSSPSSSYSAYTKNCANYGSVTNLGTSEKTYIGGIVGNLGGSNIYNCLNYGTIAYNGTTSSSDLYLGGILGRSGSAYIKNCVSAGKISTQDTSLYNQVGSIVGYVSSDTHIDNCYYTDNVNVSSLYGYAHETPSVEGTPTSPSTVDSGLIYDLNTYASTNEWNKWLYNEYKASVPFIVLYGKGFALDSQIILLPDPTGGSERTFSGWYLDFDLTSPFTSNQVDKEITLYGVLCAYSYVVTLDLNGGDRLGEGKNEMTVRCNGYYETFPTPTKTEYRFAGWFTKSEGGNKIESGDKITRLYNHTLYAHWLDNNQYLVMFDVNGGDVLADDNIIVTFDSQYGTLPNADRTGYDFYGWYTEREGGVRIESSTVVSTSSDHTLYACWYGKGLTVTLDVNGGEKLSTTTMEATFNSTYNTFPVPTREGYMFMGWLTSRGEVVKNGSIVSIPSDHTLYAQWDTPTKLVEVVFNETHMALIDVEDIVKERVGNDVKLTAMSADRISISESMAVVKFKDINDAKEFVEAIVLGESDDVIKKVGFNHNDSLSLPLYPILSFIFMLLWA